MRILVDMDGVLADFEGRFLKLWRAEHPEAFFIPFEERRTFYLVDQYPKELHAAILDILNAPGFFRELAPVPGGQEALAEMEALGLDAFICTSPFNKGSIGEKIEWIDAHLGREWAYKTIVAQDKTLVRGDFLIDDRPEILGVEEPSWEHILFDQPYNRAVNEKRRVTWSNWKEILLSKGAR